MRKLCGLADRGCLGRVLRDPDHQENTEERDAAGDQERCNRIHAGNHHAEHRAGGVADVGQGVAQGKRLGALAHGQVFAEDRLRADQEQRRGGFGDHQGGGGQVEVVGEGQQHKADGAGEHREDQQPALFEAVDDVTAVEREQGGDEHRDAQQQANVLLVEAEFVAQEQREQRAGDGAADDDGQRNDHQPADNE